MLALTLTLPLNANIAFAVTGNQTNTTNSTPNTIQNITSNNTTVTAKTTNNATSTAKLNNTTSTQNTTKLAAGSPAATTSTTNKTIKVLIYNGVYAAQDLVTGLETALNYANAHNLVPGIHFTYATSTVINSATLAGYNVVNIPGGDGGKYYLGTSSISGSAIRNFVANGGGYLGICAGAYAATNHVDGLYNGWGIAPDVNAKSVSYEGLLSMQFTSAGQQILGRNGTISIHHYNGPAMYVTGGNAIIMATYADTHTGYKGYADIVGDYYGNGRSILIGSHPELSPVYPDIIAKAIQWAANIYPTNTSTSTVTISQIGAAATSVKNYIATNNKLPNYVTINNQQISMPKFLYLLTTATLNVNSGSSAAISVKNVSSPTSSSGSFKSGTILKSEYLSIAQKIKSFITTNGRAPNYANTSLGQISFNKLVYMFSKIMSFYQTNNRLPNNVSIAP